jgi:hypothetical protein
MPITLNGTSGITLGANSALTFGDSSTLPSATFSPIYPISASVAANAMTVTLNPCSLAFRSTTLGSGATSTVSVTSAITMTVSSGSTLGTVNATQSQIVVLAINNAGTIELAVVNIAGGNNLDETTLITTTAEGGAGAADSSNVIYSTTARTSVAFRVVGVIISTQTTAGTWATAPSTIQGMGGQALTSMQSIGYGQTWQSVTRNAGTTYYNTTSRPIHFLMAYAAASGANDYVTLTIGSQSIAFIYGVLVSGVVFGQNSAIIPPGASYSYTQGTSATKNSYELR